MICLASALSGEIILTDSPYCLRKGWLGHWRSPAIRAARTDTWGSFLRVRRPWEPSGTRPPPDKHRGLLWCGGVSDREGAPPLSWTHRRPPCNRTLQWQRNTISAAKRVNLSVAFVETWTSLLPWTPQVSMPKLNEPSEEQMCLRCFLTKTSCSQHHVLDYPNFVFAAKRLKKSLVIAELCLFFFYPGGVVFFHVILIFDPMYLKTWSEN